MVERGTFSPTQDWQNNVPNFKYTVFNKKLRSSLIDQSFLIFVLFSVVMRTIAYSISIAVIKVSSQSRTLEFNVFSIIHLNKWP